MSMAVYKRLLTPQDQCLDIEFPISSQELQLRKTEYPILTINRFSFNRAKEAFEPIKFNWKGQTFDIQLNSCLNPLCKNHGLPQERFNIKSKPYRYKLNGSNYEKAIQCNPDRVDPDGIPTLGCRTISISNWSLVEEIERLVRINSVVPVDKGYEFHKSGCLFETLTPFTHSKSFYKKGLNSAKSQRYQCKECKKITSVSPTKSKSTTFNQQRNDILPLFAKLLINKNSINRTCEILDIGKGTYYQKLKWLYRCCLEFLETRETKPLEKKQFDELWITTDKLHYVLNNVLKKGQGKNRGLLIEDKQLPTFIVGSADMNSRYVFRSDVAYDWDISIDQIEEDTEKYKEDHLNLFSRKNARFGNYSAFPMKPTPNDTQTKAEYQKELNQINARKYFVDGLHVNAGYTTTAHLWLMKNLLNSKKWRFITDDDLSLKPSISRTYSAEIGNKDAHHFLCLTDKTLTRKQAKDEFNGAIRYLKSWAKANKYEYKNFNQLALWYIEEQLKFHKFHKRHNTPDGEFYFTQEKNRLEHPIPTSDRGKRDLDVLTNVSHLTNYQLASLLVQVNDNAINGFFQTVRRRLSILERPLVTARGDGKSYIYSNFNPKYSQMAITILRTYYNFCLPYKTPGIKKTPAQRLGIADKVYTWEDIIYKR